MVKKAGYMVLRVHRWEDLRLRTPLGLTPALSAENLPDLGFLPLFESEEDAVEHYPGATVLPFTYDEEE